jgi:hypothetical protein
MCAWVCMRMVRVCMNVSSSYLCMYVCVCVFFEHMYVRMCAYVWCICMCACVYMYACMHVCDCIVFTRMMMFFLIPTLPLSS